MSTNVQSLFGLMADELVEISYFDAKMFNDQAKEWRDHCRRICKSIHRTRNNMGDSRDLIERRKLKVQIAYYEEAFLTFWRVYRDAQRTSIDVQNLYIMQIRGNEGYRVAV